jgi:hypothetical protein
MDPLRQRPRPVQRLVCVAPHFVDEGGCCGGIGGDQAAGLLQIDRQPDEVLLRAVVELTLDPAAIGVGGQHEPRPRRAQLLRLLAKPLDRLLQRLDAPIHECVRLRSTAETAPVLPSGR